jgi:hypothetical protein
MGIETLGQPVSKCQDFKKAKVGVKKTHEFPKTGASENENKYVETDTRRLEVSLIYIGTQSGLVWLPRQLALLFARSQLSWATSR